MRRCRVWLLLGILLWLVCLIFHPLEPRYQGTRLSEWAKILTFYEWECSNEDEQKLFNRHGEAVAAIRQIGTKALPYALKWSRAHDSKLADKFKDWANGQKLFQIHIPWAADYQRRAIGIFEALGAAGQPAIPALIELFQGKDQNAFAVAANALNSIGPATIPPLIAALTNQNAQVRQYAAVTLGGFESQASAAVPGLTDCLRDPSPEVRATAAMSLGHIKEGAATAVPALLPLLKDNNHRVREHAARALGHIGKDAENVVPALVACIETEPTNASLPFMMLASFRNFGTNAQPAVPLLVKIIETRGLMDRNAAISALRRIDPELARPYIEKRNAGISNAQARWGTNAINGKP